MQFFIVKDDEIGRELHKRLLAKAKEGVRVYFLYDEIGSNSLTKSYINELREAGAEMLDFHTRKGPGNRFQINFRNHRKIVVVDGHTAWVGGHNVGDEYMGRDPEFGHWRDTHVRITGPAALGCPAELPRGLVLGHRQGAGVRLGAPSPGRRGQGCADLPDRSRRPAGDCDTDVSYRASTLPARDSGSRAPTSCPMSR